MSDKYPSDWDSRRKKVYQRDGHTCQRCRSKGGPKGNTELHAHHKTPISKGGSHSYSNLTTLCQSCHSKEHGHPVGGGSNTAGDNTSDNDGLFILGFFSVLTLLGTVYVNLFSLAPKLTLAVSYLVVIAGVSSWWSDSVKTQSGFVRGFSVFNAIGLTGTVATVMFFRAFVYLWILLWLSAILALTGAWLKDSEAYNRIKQVGHNQSKRIHRAFTAPPDE